MKTSLALVYFSAGGSWRRGKQDLVQAELHRQGAGYQFVRMHQVSS